jgi:hypothetical protein
VAVPAAFPDRLLRRVPRARQPGHPVGRPGREPGDAVPPRAAHDQRRAVADRGHRACRDVLHLRAQVRLLLRGHQARVLSPGSRQLLLRAVDRGHVPRHRPPARLRARADAPGAVVRVRAAALRARAQDIRAVAVGGKAATVQGGQPVVAPLRGRQLRRGHPGREGRLGGSRQVPLGHRCRALPRCVRDVVPEAAHQRGAAQGAASGVLHVHRHAVGREPRLERHLRQLRCRGAHLLLHGDLPVPVPRRTHQLLPRFQVSTHSASNVPNRLINYCG